jgi:hypothetical protein
MIRSLLTLGTLLLVLAAVASQHDALAAPTQAPIDATLAAGCEIDSTIVVHNDASLAFLEAADAPCPNGPADSLEADRAYLVETATLGGTMLRQGPELAIGRLNPEFVGRLAEAIREARAAGLVSVGIFSAYRPPAFGVGGFSDKFESLHTYGLAVDMAGIGGAGSPDAKLWYEIAARHDVVCPYGFDSHTEWNHCQPTRIKIIRPESPLRETVTAEGPIDLESMFDAGTALIARSAGPQGRPLEGLEAAVEHSLERRRVALAEGSHRHGTGLIRIAKATRSEKESRHACEAHQHRAGKDACGSPRHEASARHQIAHLHAGAGGRQTRRI